METTATTAIKKINDRLTELDKNSLRYKILETALHFKTNWIELGEKLYHIYKSGEYKSWGYNSYDKYCTQEIGIRKSTAEKLTTSYYYLKEHEPRIVSDPRSKDIPDINTISFLANVKADENVPEEKYEEFKQAAFDEGCSDRILKKRYKNFLKEMQEQHDDADAEDDNELNKKELLSLIHIFERIDRKVDALAGLPVEIKTDIRRILTQLKSLP